MNLMNDMHQGDLVWEAQQGSPSAFAGLVEMHRDSLLSYLMVLCGDRDRAEDIAQETWLSAWKHIDRVDNPAGFKTWLLTIARNRFYNDHRWHKKRRFASYERLLAKIGDHLPRPFRSPDPNESFAEREQVREILEQMPASLSEPLMLGRGWGLNSVEIAAVLDVSPNAESLIVTLRTLCFSFIMIPSPTGWRFIAVSAAPSLIGTVDDALGLSQDLVDRQFPNPSDAFDLALDIEITLMLGAFGVAAIAVLRPKHELNASQIA